MKRPNTQHTRTLVQYINRARTMRLLLILALLVASMPWLPALPVRAATRTVTTNADSGAGSLRNTLAAASAGDEIVFQASLEGQTITLTSGELAIAKNLTITGPGANKLTISAGDTSRIFNITSGTVSISGLTITKGRAPDNQNGGAILVSGESTNVTITSCAVTDSVNVSNTLGKGGAGIAVSGGSTLTVNKSTLSGNITDNTGLIGGGILNDGSTVTLNNTTISGNIGGIAGGGIATINNGTLAINYSTIANNKVKSNLGSYTDGAGGVDNMGTSAVTIQASIIAQNGVGVGNDASIALAADCKGTFTSGGYTIVETLSYSSVTCGWTGGTGDQTGVAARLRPLAQSSYGTMPTLQPAPDSPAVNAIPSGTNSCGTAPYDTDQRGVTRPFEGTVQACEIGAHELVRPKVTSIDDSGAGTLRQAISDVDEGDVITFADSLHGQTITLDTNLDIARDMTIEGPGANQLTVTTNYGARAFSMTTSGTDVTIRGLTITTTYYHPANNTNALQIEAANVWIDACTISTVENHSDTVVGGAIGVINSGTLTVSNSLITNNVSVNTDGGGIAVDNSTLTVIRSTISGNRSGNNGGGIAVLNGGTATISESTISGNESDSDRSNGGGILNQGSTSALIINNSTISGNKGGSNGGGIYSEGSLSINYSSPSLDVNECNYCCFPVMENKQGSCTNQLGLLYSTIVNNYVHPYPYDPDVVGTGGVENVGTTPITIQGSIIAGNYLVRTGNYANNCKGTFTSQGYNLVDDLIDFLGATVCSWTSGTGDQLNVAAHIGALQDNGGPTQTHMPQIGSPARGAIPSGSNGCGTDPYDTDQRGKSRIGTCDMGAVEAYTAPPVTSTADSGVGSLRQAISDTDPGTTITFDAALNGQTITLASQLNIAKELTIQGPGASNLTISGNNTSRVFNVDTSGSLWLSGITVAQGKVSGADQSGAGILTKGNLTLVDSKVMHNTIESVSAGNGGAGIASLGNVTLAITNSTMSNNTVTGTGGMGGGIASLNGSRLDIATSTIAGNSVAGSGGGIASSGPNVATTILTSTISGNSATGNGGGVLSSGTDATITVMNSTLSGNSATGNGGGFANGTTSTAAIGNATISGNSASTGGGFFHDVDATALSLNFTTIVSNTASTSGGGIANAHTTNNVVVKNSILARNAGNTASPDCSGKIELYQYGLLGSQTGCSVTKTELKNIKTSIPPHLAPLADNGGATWTHLPLPNPDRAVINHIYNDVVHDCYEGPPYNTDQRGNPRPAVVGGACDIGAVELFNDQPIPTTTEVTLASIETNATNPPGETVANLFGPIYTDENDDPFAGVVILRDTNFVFGTPSTEGLWQYSTDDGQTWTDLNTYSSSIAFVVQPTTKLRFLPNQDYTGTPNNVIIAALWDGTSGQVGQTNDYQLSRTAAAADGTYSQQQITLSTTVGSNSPPTGGNDTVTTDEDVPYTFRNTDFTFNDPNPSDTLDRVKIATLPAKGTLMCSSVVVAAGDECTNPGGRLVYTPGADEYGSPYTSFKFKVGDSVGAYSTDEYVMTINVTPKNDPPSISKNIGASLFRGTLLTISANHLSATDVDDSATTLTYVVDKLPVHGVLSNGTTALATGGTFTQQDIVDGRLTYQHDNSETNADSFTFKVRDASGAETTLQTFNVVISKMDSELRPISFTKSITEDTALAFTPLDFTAHVSHTSEVSVENILIIGMPTNGTLWLATKQVALWQVIPITDITTLVYSPTLNYNGSDAFLWNASTVNGYAATTATVTLAITPTNDPPVLTYVSKIGAENTPVAFKRQDFVNAFTDIDSPVLVSVKIVSLPLHGRLLLGNTPVSEQQVIVAADLDTLVFIPDSSWSSTTSFLWNASDGVVYADTDARANIFISSNKNDAPIVADITRQGMEDTPIVLSASELVSPPNFVELDEDDGLETLKIVSLPQHGTLNNGSTPVQAGQEIARANLVNLTFVPEANWSGNTSFAWNASDGETYATSDAQVKLTIDAVNDPPVLTDIAMQTSVNTPITLDSSLFSQHYTDVENSPVATVRIVALPANGSVYLNGAVVQRYQEINRTALDTLSFQPADDWSGTTTLSWNASDGQAYAQNAATLTIAVRPTNAPPTDLLLSNGIIASSAPADTVVGTLTALDANDGDTQSFAMVDGAGSDDNARFAIRGNELRTATAMDATTPTRLRVRIQATDSYGASIERAFSIIVSSEPLATVTGQVVHADNASAVVQAVVTARAVRDDGRVDIGGIAQDAFTDEQGIFTMKLPVGSSYEVFVRSLPVGDAADYYVSDTPATFTLQADTSEKTLDPIRVPRAVKHIVGTVSYSATLGVAGATVKATNNDTAVKKYATTNASGQYTITVSGGTWTVALMPPGNGAAWIFSGLPQVVPFVQPAQEPEQQRADFTVQQATYFITGRILGVDTTPLVLLPGQHEIGLILWDMTNQREIIVYLEPDGSFRVPVRDGSVYRIRGWVDHRQRPDMRLPDIAPREITGGSLDMGTLSLVRLQASISGRVTGRDGAGMPGVTVAAWKGQSQFSARSDNDGFYTIRVPYGTWSVSPDVGNLATASFLYEGGAKKVVVSKREDTAQATFIVSRAGASVSGTVVDETGSLVDARLFVGIVRLNRTAPAIVVPVVDGTFALRVPENCATCTYRATAGENNAYSVVAGSENPRIETQPDGTQKVVYTVRMDTGNVVGRLRNAKTDEPVSGVRGTATLRNASNSYATAIQSDGSYQFEHVADGNYTLSYELERAPGHVLANNDYVPFPLQPQTLTVRNGVVVPSQRSTSLQAGSGDANVTNGKSFTVQTKTSCASTQATDSPTETLRAYPVTVVCEFANGTIRNFSCEAQPDDTSMCYTNLTSIVQEWGTAACVVIRMHGFILAAMKSDWYYKPDVSPPPTCSVVTGEAAGNNAVDSTTGSSIVQVTGPVADVGATIDAILAETGNVEQVRAYLQGEHVTVPSLGTTVYLARRPDKQTNPRRTKLGEETERNGAIVEMQDRQRDTYMFGMLRGPDGAYIRNEPVQVMAAAGGNDGQVRTVETTEGYYLFEIAQSRENWTMTASMDKDGVRYRATTTVNVAQLLKNGTVFVPDMTLVEVGAIPPAASQSFDSAAGMQMTLAATDESQDTPMLAAASEPAITVDVPPAAVSVETSNDVRMTIETVAVPSTGVYQVIGDGYRITLSDRSSGRVVVDALDTPLVVTLPYNAAALAAAGVTATQLQAATFSDDSLAWTPLVESSVDTDAGVVRAQLERTTDVIALVVPVREPQTARAIAGTGESSRLTFVLQDGSAITSTLDVPAGLTVQPGVGLAATSVTPVAVAEVQITAPVKHGQQLAAGSVLIGGFTVDLLDEQGAVIPQGQLSQPLRLTLRFEDARVPAGAIINMARVDAFTTALSAWEPTTLVQDVPASHATVGVSTLVATSDVAGQFAVVANDHAMLYLPMVMR